MPPSATTSIQRKSHKPGGKLYGWRPALPVFKGTTFMTRVRWNLYRRVKEQYPDTEVQLTYGAAPKGQCRELDRKKRRNNRILEKLYGGKYINLREEKKRSRQELACDRTNRDHTRDTENLHRYRGTKVSAGRRSICRKRYPFLLHNLVVYQGQMTETSGCHNKGIRLLIGKNLLPLTRYISSSTVADII